MTELKRPVYQQMRDKLRGYPCESCGAEPGEDCKTKTGAMALWPHASRYNIERLERR